MASVGAAAAASSRPVPGLARRLGRFDATMIVMGGMVGSGIFMNPYVVARQVHTPFLILAAWGLGGLIALAGGFIYAELAARRPDACGQYDYIREAYHPLLGFIYGWGLLLVVQTGGMAACAITFARYFGELTGLAVPDGAVAALALAGLTLLNCLGVRAGATGQNVLMVTKIAAIVALVGCGLLLGGRNSSVAATGGAWLDRPFSFDLVSAFGAAMVPVLFAYGGWQTASFAAGEMREPRRDLPLGLLLGVCAVVALYLAVNQTCLVVLGTAGLAETVTPASDVMRIALGPGGARLIAAGIAISTLGLLSQAMLTSPRVYFTMARDGLFPAPVARLNPKTHVPVVAIVLQGVFAIVIALSGRFEQILNYVVSVDFIFFALTAGCVFAFRRRGKPGDAKAFAVPGHPWTTALFMAACVAVVANALYRYPGNSVIGFAILAAGVPVYFAMRNTARAKTTS